MISTTKHWLLLTLAVLVARSCAASAADAPLKIHIISGAAEYKSEPSLKEFKEFLEKHYRVTCTASWGKDGAVKLDNLDAVPSADLLIVFARRLKLEDEHMRIVRKHWEQGKPVIGIRTASHAFQAADNAIFDKQVLGGSYRGAGDYTTPFKAIAAEGKGEHPLLKEVGSITSKGYYNNDKLADGAIVVQVVESMKKIPPPVTWVHTFKGGRMFYTSMGTPEDFKQDAFRRLLINAVFWTTQRVPEKMKQ